MSKRVLVLACCAITLCLALGGCGGSGSASSGASSAGNVSEAANESAASSSFVGTWDIVEISVQGKKTDKLAIEGMKKDGGDFYAQLDENGTLTVVTDDKVITSAWEQTSDTEGRFADSTGTTYAMSLKDGQLVLEIGDNSELKLERGEPRAELPKAHTTSNASSSTSSATKSSKSSAASKNKSQKYEASIDDITVGEDYKGNPALIVTYTWKNNSDKSRSFMSSLYPRCYQNGVQLGTAIVMSGIDSEGYMADVKPGYGTTLQMAYELKDTTNPVDVEVYEFASFEGDPIAAKTYKF